MNEQLAHNVDKLTNPWTDVLSVEGEYKSVEYDPLLDMLRAAVSSSIGRTQSGRSESDSRSVLNLRAFTLWERIDGQTRAWLGQLQVTAPKDLKEAVTALYSRIDTLWSSNQVAESEYVRLGDMVGRWADDIWAIFDPPVEKEIVGSCPECGEEFSYGPEGERSSAIRAYYWQNVEPYAECRRCEWQWRGRTQLVQLAYRIGAPVDEDALRDLEAS